MGILEDVLLNARTAVDSVGKKAGKMIDMSKLTLAAADLKAEISKKYEILGRVIFESKQTGKNYDKSVEELIEKIADLQAQLKTVNEAIGNSKQKAKCPSCGAYNAKGSVFCNKCGEKLPYTEQEEISPDDVIDFTEDNFEDDDIGL